MKLFSDSVIASFISNGLTSIPAADTTIITLMVNGIISKAENYCNRKFEFLADETEYLEPVNSNNKSEFYLKRYPISSVSLIVPMEDYTFDDNNALDLTKTFVHNEKGIIEGLDAFSNIKYKIVYDGGYDNYLTTGSAMSGDYTLPDDLALALLQQFKFEWENRLNLGQSNTQNGDSGKQMFELKDGLLTEVRVVLDRYKRYIDDII